MKERAPVSPSFSAPEQVEEARDECYYVTVKKPQTRVEVKCLAVCLSVYTAVSPHGNMVSSGRLGSVALLHRVEVRFLTCEWMMQDVRGGILQTYEPV